MKKTTNQSTRKILAILLIAAMLFTLMPAGAFAAGEEAAEPASISYLDADGNVQTCTGATKITSGETCYLNSNCYYVQGSVTTDWIDVTGDVHLILCDGAELTASNGVVILPNDEFPSSLTIYGQEAGTGKLIADSTKQVRAGIDISNSDATTVTINGGVVEAKGGSGAAGIGSYSEYSGRVIINGGTVTAVGGSQSAGIGAGSNGHTVKVMINGGTVNATRGDGAIDDIGCGERENGEKLVVINGGSVNAEFIRRSDKAPINGNTTPEFLTRKEVWISDGYVAENLVIRNADGTDYPYGKRDMRPDENGILYLWLPEGVIVCYDSDNDHICDDCDATLSECKDADANDMCDICGQKMYFAVTSNLTNLTGDGAAKVMKNQDYTVKLTPASGYTAPFTVEAKAGGTTISAYQYERSLDNSSDFFNGALTIPADSITGDITITASADKVHYVRRDTLAFPVNEGYSMLEMYGDDVNDIVPEKDGYTFKGWYSDEALTQPYDFSTKVTADVTIYPKWEENTSSGSSGSSGGSSGSSSSSSSSSDKTESTTTSTTTTASGTKVETTTVTKADGTTVETVTTTTADGKTSSVVTTTLDNGASAVNTDEAVNVEANEVSVSVVDKAEEAVKADDTADIIGNQSNAIQITAESAATGIAKTSFNEPVKVTVPVSKSVIATADNVNNLSLALVTTDANGETVLEYIGGNYDANTNSFAAYAAKPGNYVLVEKDDILKIELTIGDKTAKVNGRHVEKDTHSRIINNRTMVPLRFVGEHLNCDVHWDEATRTVTIITAEGKPLTMTIDKHIPGFGAAPVIHDNRTLVPIRYISEMLDANVVWVEDSQQVVITKA